MLEEYGDYFFFCGEFEVVVEVYVVCFLFLDWVCVKCGWCLVVFDWFDEVEGLLMLEMCGISLLELVMFVLVIVGGWSCLRLCGGFGLNGVEV